MSGRTKLALITLAIIVIALLALQTPLLATLRGSLWRIVVATTGRLSGLNPFVVEQSIEDELTTLRAENIRLKTEAADHDHLRQQLGTTTFDSLRAIPALLTTQPIDVFRAERIINRGAADGVTLGTPVVTHGSILVGFVSDLHEHTATIRLLLHPATSLPARVVENAQARGLLIGRTYTSVALTTIPRDTDIEPNQSVITTAQPTIPAGLLIGTINTISNEENEAYQEATIAVPYDPDNLDLVTVLVAP